MALLAAVATSGCLLTLEPGASGTVDLAPGGADVVRLLYLGTGGWAIEHDDELILTAPLVSNPGLFATGLTRIRSDTMAINRYLSAYDSTWDFSRASAILVGHGHYDHLMDVPHTARRFAPDAEIIGSRTVGNLLGTWSGLADRVRIVNDSAGDQLTAGPWLRFGSRTRVMALRSSHAPHFEGYTLYSGTQDTPTVQEPAWATDWLGGETLAFLIDFMSPDDPDSVVFRIYYQDAVPAAPAGFAPEALVADRPIDVAILLPSTFDQVDWHPEAFVENLDPRWVLIGHWEDFFAPVDMPTRSMRLADLGHFESRLERTFTGAWWRPDLGTEFRFPAG